MENDGREFQVFNLMSVPTLVIFFIDSTSLFSKVMTRYTCSSYPLSRVLPMVLNNGHSYFGYSSQRYENIIDIVPWRWANVWVVAHLKSNSKKFNRIDWLQINSLMFAADHTTEERFSKN